MWKDCTQKDCPINKNGKCLSGNAHKKDFDKDCLEKEKIIKLHKGEQYEGNQN